LWKQRACPLEKERQAIRNREPAIRKESQAIRNKQPALRKLEPDN
jgi:hypothetical protein